MSKPGYLFIIVLGLALLVTGCGPRTVEAGQVIPSSTPPAAPDEAPLATPADAVSTPPSQPEAETVVEFSLETMAADGKLLFVGVGGDLDGVVNPDLVVPPGATVHLTLINGDGKPHDLSVPDFYAKTRVIGGRGKTAELSFTVGEHQAGTFAYFCTVPGHRQAGQEGQLIVQESAGQTMNGLQ